MKNKFEKARSIFSPPEFIITESETLKNSKLVQYTSASSAMSIIRNNEVWLRNVQCMNDFNEVNHGINCLITAFDTQEGKSFQALLGELFPDIIEKFVNRFNEYLPALKQGTYITCVSEHDQSEDIYGRLSMWRAYGGKQSVAMVMNTKAFRSATDVLSAYTFPVLYQEPEEFHLELEKLTRRIEIEKKFVSDLEETEVMDYIFDLFKTYALCIKHPGFKEEREWRIVYNPLLGPSEYVTSSIELVDGVPQEIHKIPLKNFPEESLTGMEIPELIDRIIIGPNEHQIVMRNTFIKLLGEAGCENPGNKVFTSGIPLR